MFPLNVQATAGWPIKKTPRYSTITQIPASGRSPIKIATMLFPLWDFVMDFTYIRGDATGTNTAWQQLVNFYMAVQGAADTWLFLDPYDNLVGSYTITGSVQSGSGIFIAGETVTQTHSGASATLLFAVTGSNNMIIGPWSPVGHPPVASYPWTGATSGAVYNPTSGATIFTSQAIGTGDGNTTAFTMYRSLVTGGAQDLIQNFAGGTPPNYTVGSAPYSYGSFPYIYVNGVLQTSGYSINQYGTLTFTTAPTAGYPIAWVGVFLYLCAFEEDSWKELSENLYTYWSLEGLKFSSILL